MIVRLEKEPNTIKLNTWCKLRIKTNKKTPINGMYKSFLNLFQTILIILHKILGETIWVVW